MAVNSNAMRAAVGALAAGAILGLGAAALLAQETGRDPGKVATPYAAWKNGPPADPDFFPLAVWMQPTRRAKDYRNAGVNLYVGLWQGPTEKQLDQLREAGMPVICDMNDVGVIHKDDPIIVGWLQPDEPDILHANHGGWPELKTRKEWTTTVGQYRPPYHPDEILSRYKLMKAVDPTRPVFVSFSFAVVYPDYAARGHRKNHPEDFPQYMRGLDIVAFDIYPGIHQYKPAAAKYWTVARGVVNLRKWADGRKPVWVDIEAMKPRLDHSPHSFKAEVWMGIIHGACGINYYVHQNASGSLPIPSIEDSVFEDAEMLKAFAATNRLVTSLAPVLNSPTVEDAATVASSVAASEEVAAAELDPIAVMVKRHQGATYLFSVRMENSPARGTFQVKGLPDKATAEVIGEDRTIEVKSGAFSDDFEALGVRLYRIAGAG